MGMIKRKNLKIQNKEGYPPTFRNRRTACLDVTLAGGSVRVGDWQATHDLTSSDHAMIRYGIRTQGEATENSRREKHKYSTTRIKWDEFRKTLTSGRDKRRAELECADVDTNAIALMEVLTIACGDKHAKMGSRTRAKERNARRRIKHSRTMEGEE